MAIRVIGSLDGGEPRVGRFTLANDASVVPGQMLTLASNEADAGTSNDTTFIGIALEVVDNAADGLSVEAVLSPTAVYAWFDGTAHAAGATLDLNSGGLTLTTNTNADFTVIKDNTATEDVQFIITPGEHYLHASG